jgi:hypothetical protein
MTARVYFLSKACAIAVAFHKLGQDPAGAWGLVEDAARKATPGASCLELLYVSEADYRHAMRGLPAPEIANAIQHRRKTHGQRFDGESNSLVQEAIWGCINRTGDDEIGRKARAKLVALHAKLIHVRMRGDQDADEWLEDLMFEEAELLVELESVSLRPKGAAKDSKEERDTRRRFVQELGALSAARSHDKKFYWPHVEIQRTYAVTPATAELQRMSRREGEGETGVKWRDVLLMPLHEREAKRIEKLGFHPKPVLATPGELLAARYLLTKAQFDVELGEKLAAPDFRDAVQESRIAMASLREAARQCTRSDAKLNAILARQIEVELRQFPIWSKRTPAGEPASTLAATLADAASLVNLVAAMQLEKKDLRAAAENQAVAEALAKVLEEP